MLIKGMQGLGSGFLPANDISPLIPTLFLRFIFPYSSAAPLPQVGLLLVPIMENYSVIKKTGLLPFLTTEIDLEGTKLS